MAKITEPVTARVLDIAARIHTACGAIRADTAAIQENMKDTQERSANLTGTRIGVASEISAMAHAEDWTAGEVALACDKAAKMGNAEDQTAKTMGVFISEMKLFANPKVRVHFVNLLETCEAVWAYETELLAGADSPEEKANLETPVRKWQSRKYHLLANVARAVKEAKLAAPLTQDSLTQYARDNDPDHNETKVAGRLKGIIETLGKMYADFGLNDIQVATEYLGTITAKDLLASRKAMLDAEEDRLAAHPLTDLPPAVAPVQAPARPHMVLTNPPEISEGVADLDDFMNDRQSSLLAAD